MIGIYKITNLKNNKVYIGQSVDIERRWSSYYCLGVKVKGQPKLYRSLNKYGLDKHKFEIVTTCEKEELNKLERYYQELYNSVENGLNCVYQSEDGGCFVHTEETKRKISEANKGELNAFYGKTHTEETRRKLSLMYSRKVLVKLDNEDELIFKSVKDCADFFGCTTKNILFRNKRRKQGITPSFGMFKGVYLEILEDE